MSEPTNDFDAQARAPGTGIVAEFIDFLRHNKKWWLLPVILVMLLVGLLVIAAGSPLAPFLYALW